MNDKKKRNPFSVDPKKSKKEGVKSTFELDDRIYNTIIFEDLDDANKFMERNPEYSLIGIKHDQILGEKETVYHLAKSSDKGKKIKSSEDIKLEMTKKINDLKYQRLQTRDEKLRKELKDEINRIADKYNPSIRIKDNKNKNDSKDYNYKRAINPHESSLILRALKSYHDKLKTDIDNYKNMGYESAFISRLNDEFASIDMLIHKMESGAHVAINDSPECEDQDKTESNKSKSKEKEIKKLDEEYEKELKKREIDKYSKKANDIWHNEGYKDRFDSIIKKYSELKDKPINDLKYILKKLQDKLEKHERELQSIMKQEGRSKSWYKKLDIVKDIEKQIQEIKNKGI